MGNGVIKSSNKASLLRIGLFAYFWNGLSLPLCGLIDFSHEVSKGNWPILLALMFPIVGLGIVSYMIYKFMAHKKFGEVLFYLDNESGIVGGPLTGSVVLNACLPDDAEVYITLNCLKIDTSGDSTSEKILWQKEYATTPQPYGNDSLKIAVPIQFAIPYSAKECYSGAYPKITWQLKLKAKCPGVDFASNFEVPVFQTEASQKGFKLSTIKKSDIVQEISLERTARDQKIIVEDNYKGERVYTFGMFRQLLNTFMCLFATGWFIAFGVIFQGAGIGYLFYVIAVYTLYGFFDMGFYKSTLVIGNDDVTIRNGLFGIRFFKDIPIQNISTINKIKQRTSGNYEFYKLMLQTSDGANYKVAVRVVGKDMAKSLTDDMMLRIRQNKPN